MMVWKWRHVDFLAREGNNLAAPSNELMPEIVLEFGCGLASTDLQPSMTNAAPGTCDRSSLLVPDLVNVPAAEFCMGCETGRADERPVHHVWVDGFAMASTTVTNQQYLVFVQATGRTMPLAIEDASFNDPCQPVVAVTWFDAIGYCDWMSQQTGFHFRLPTEAEWELAVRDGRQNQLYAWGDDPPDTLERYRTGWGEQGPHRVALHPPNALGLFDLGDNIHEWCFDWYDPEYYQRSASNNPVNLDATKRRASRGGAWRHRVKVSRCAARSSLSPDFAYTDYGFRVVKAREIRASG